MQINNPSTCLVEISPFLSINTDSISLQGF
jgi:hypothetical protein